jgi:hypothetical protein
MSDFPALAAPGVAYGILSTMGEGSPIGEACLISGNAANGNAVMPGANVAMYIPVLVPDTATVYKLAWLNGATVAGNVDVGVYDFKGSRLVSSGSTAQSGVSAIQVADIADTVIRPGLYYLALATDSATATFQRGFVTTQLARASGACQQSTAFVLPATATFGNPSAANMPLIVGVTAGAMF